MTIEEIVRAWKDRNYREGLNNEALAQLPDNPSGMIEIPVELLDAVVGAGGGGVVPNYPVTLVVRQS